MYELMSSDYNVTANQIIWNGARYNRDETGYKRIDELENLVEIPKDCDVKDIWAVKLMLLADHKYVDHWLFKTSL